MAIQTYPYNDDELIFNETLQQYQATSKLAKTYNLDLNVLDNLGVIDINRYQNDYMAQRTDDIYRCILGRNPNTKIVRYVLKTSPEYREKIKRWTIMQTEYVMFGGQVGEHTGFNASTGKVTKLSDLRGDRMYSAQMLDEMRNDGILNKSFMNYLPIEEK